MTDAAGGDPLDRDASGGDPAPHDPQDPAVDDEAAHAGIREVAPGIARLAGGAWLRAAERTAGVYLRAGNRVIQAAVSGEPVEDLVQDARAYARELLGLDDEGPAAKAASEARAADRPSNLRQRGAELLRRSTDVNFKEEAHPAYARILSELSPDEARILRLLATEGAQPTVDVRTNPPLNIGSHLLAPGLSMIGEQAGCRHLDQIPAYLTNLFRLGLIWFSREPLRDPLRYQVLEAQPDVLGAMKSVRRAKTVRRSIHLTPLGRDFCDICLPLDTIEFEAITGSDSLGDENDDAKPADRVDPVPDLGEGGPGAAA